ncbi:MAG: uracil-DNA glycosylase [Dehalococcoidia bacterium]|nr:uracil-DNA glycosylase [Dehalococcoidia bacterium]
MTALPLIHDQVRACTRCELARTRTRAVPGEGPADAEVMFIGEGPGFNEDQQGRPFVGQAGKLLDQLIELAGLRRQDVFITNIVKCRPPGNRDPLPNEIEACSGYLTGQLETIAPRIVVTLGRYSMARFFPGQTISRIHGHSEVIGNVTYMAMYHPAAALRQQALRQAIEADFRKLGEIIAALGEPGEAESAPKPTAQTEQLRLM